MLVGVTVERGHPRNRINIEDGDGNPVLVDTTGLTHAMLDAARTVMDSALVANIQVHFLRPQDILVRYAHVVDDPDHLWQVWHAIPYEERRQIPSHEQTLFRSFYAALRRWRLDSALYIQRVGWYEGMRRDTGPGLLYHPGQHGRHLSATTTTTSWPPMWQVVPAPDVNDFAERWSTRIEAMTQRALRAGGLNPDEITAEWPRASSSDASDNLGVSPRRRRFMA